MCEFCLKGSTTFNSVWKDELQKARQTIERYIVGAGKKLIFFFW